MPLAKRWTPILLASLVVPLTVGAVGSSPVRDLLTAARRGDVDGVRRALDEGAPVDATDPSFRQTALIRAAMFDQAEVARLLVAAKTDLRRDAFPEGMRAIHWAAQRPEANVLRVLIDAGDDANAPDALGTRPLEYALTAGAASAVEALLAAGADPETLREPISGRIGRALNNEVPGPEVDAMVALIRGGRGLERASGHVGERTALLALASRANRPGAERMAEALVAAGADLGATDEQGRTARQIVDAWIPSQRNAGYRKTLEAVAAVLRRAEARR